MRQTSRMLFYTEENISQSNPFHSSKEKKNPQNTLNDLCKATKITRKPHTSFQVSIFSSLSSSIIACKPLFLVMNNLSNEFPPCLKAFLVISA